MVEVTQADVAAAIDVFTGSRPSMTEVDRMAKLFARHRIAARKQALEEAAMAAHEHLYPSNPEDDWTRYAMDKARFARTTATAIRALSDSHVDQD